MSNIPQRLMLANLPTRIEKLDNLTQKMGGPNIYLKRDDQTGSELAGNKIRKLEFAVQEALDQDCKCLITTGALQSNHARATAAVAARLGLKCCLPLFGEEISPDGNYFIDKLLGADVRIVPRSVFVNSEIDTVMNELKAEYDEQGEKAYIIPGGASNGIGAFGYYQAMDEIIQQQKQMDLFFDCIVVACGSAGTYAGLFLGDNLLQNNTQIFGFSVGAQAAAAKGEVKKVLDQAMGYLPNITLNYSDQEICINDEYIGEGYGISNPELIDFIKEFATSEGVILDPVYTGKAMLGLCSEIKKGTFADKKNILFIHTGGLFGLFPQKNLFKF